MAHREFLPMGEAHYFNFAGVRMLFIHEEDDVPTLYALIDNVEEPVAIADYDTRAEAIEKLNNLAHWLNTGESPATEEDLT